MFNLAWPTKKIVFDEALLNDLYRYALSLTHDQHQAYDLLQTACEKTLRLNSNTIQLKPYMLRIIRNAFIDQYRRNKLELVVDTQHINDLNLIEQTTSCELEEIIIDQQHVKLILQELSPQERELLYLWAVEGHTMQELADETNTPRGTLLARVHRLKKRLKKQHAHLVEQVS